MRFKFRAWDKEKQVLMSIKLLDWSEWWVSCNPIGVSEPLAFGERNSFNNEQTDRHIIMQYVGLKDKNGKEIYEGDVLKGHYWSYGKERRFIGKVIYGMHGFKLAGVKQYLGMAQDFNSLYEIIGNSYENPELVRS